MHTVKFEQKYHLRRRQRERLSLVAADMWVWVYRGSVQYNGYNLVLVTTVEGGTTRGTTALVYWQLHYIQVLYRVIGVHPTGLTVDQGCRQVSTSKHFPVTQTCGNYRSGPSKLWFWSLEVLFIFKNAVLSFKGFIELCILQIYSFYKIMFSAFQKVNTLRSS